MASALHIKIPIGARDAEDTRLDSNAKRIVECARGQIDIALVLFRRQRGSAGLAAGDGIRRPQRVRDTVLLPRQPPKVVALDDDDGIAIGLNEPAPILSWAMKSSRPPIREALGPGDETALRTVLAANVENI